ncbi:MAG: hypothetical protein JXR64_02470 [Spirochaetales bacterium]|nr:hypothetical protein [Spirochaetales bacterium]
MNRLEIFANQALSDIIERELNSLHEQNYTILRECAGKGNKGFALGNDVWPEHNVIFIIYVKDINLLSIKDILSKLKEKFPIIGLSGFITENCKEFI